MNLALVAAVVAVFVVALGLGLSRGEFVGTDAAATDQIAISDPGYTPWFEGFWSQPGGEVESGLFALQAAIGAGVLGFVLGSYRAKHRAARPAAPEPPDAER